jgi:hypothetical protein
VALAFAPFIASADNDKNKDTSMRPASHRVEVAVTDSGNVLVRGAKVTAVSGSTITAVTTAGASTLTWTVTTDGSTSFITSSGSGSSLGTISVGDIVSFAGALSGSGLSVKATAVKDWTVGANERSIVGTVQSVNSTGNSLTITNGKDNGNDNKKVTTIQFTNSTVVSGTGTTFGSIVAGDKVKATGTVNADGTVLTATAVTVTHPPAKLGNDDFVKKIRAWFSDHGFGFFGKGDKDKSGKDN